MTECRSEGELRAYLDRELPPGDIQSLAAHLEVCSTCAGLCAELKGRAAMVSALLDELTVSASVVRMPRVAWYRKAAWRWAGAAAALAAGLAIGVLTKPDRPPPIAAIRPAPVPAEPPAPAPAATAASAVIAPQPARARSVTVRKPVRETMTPPDDFVALDDEPIDTGIVVRVALGPTGIPADVLYGLDGKPHAIRLVNEKSKSTKNRTEETRR